MAFTTSKSLLARVRNGDEISWNEFYTSYKPLILLCGYDCHLSTDENEELVQKVMCEIFRKDILGKYDIDNVPDDIVFQHDPEKGRFRHYLRKIIRNQALKIVTKRKEHLSLDDDSGISENLSSPDQWKAVWDEEWRKHVLNEALTELKCRIQSETYVSFEMYAIQNRPVQEVAEFLNVSVSAVYTAKSRCISELKKIIEELEDR